ncbi:sulfatase [Chthoniobacter flavus Ellin428]|uniref:Sulfatase n=1 Tax=Chthoniobacter flavus Ellin428 TaxID=497964 RepID=B4D4S5_9BACT|nr:sulfatase [Chthoniobacter flavus]EDY18528.1 sulfatase [Chthoniobacter flavus Ellin428]TCO91015.1 arylsulfatase A-like enzyme [Chthoniobacter flavus]
MKRLTLLLASCLAAATTAFAATPDKPNILFILADDMGWSDLGCYGADLHETPNIDRFASGAVRFTSAYAMSVCSPSRSTLMTGKHAARLHFTIWAEGAQEGGAKNRELREAESIWNLPNSEKTIATYLKSAGYLTALIGKWHLGDWEHYPEAHGFDINIGGTNWGAPQTFWWPYSGSGTHGPEFRYIPHLEYGHPGEYLTDRLTDEAIKVIDHAGDQPFFVYLAHHAVHTPIEAKADDIQHFDAKYRDGMNHRHTIYAAMNKELDENVGRVLEHLKERGLDKNTVVIFASDNGGYIGVDKVSGKNMPVTNNAPLRSGKGALYEGGIRVPLIIRWPGVTPNGATCDEPVILTDMLQTFLHITGQPPATDATDGMDISPLLKDPSAKLNRDALFFHYPHYYHTTTPVSAIRARDWKLLEFYEDNHLELYNLRNDLSEKHDLAKEMPDKAAALRDQLNAWRDSVGAVLPQPNPDFKGGKPKPQNAQLTP